MSDSPQRAAGVEQAEVLEYRNAALPVKDRMANELERFFVEETRLGIPVIFHEECLHGLAAR